jgi:glycopeptide antibiotics resistance protein
LVAFGLGLEIAQSITGYRFGDPLDLLANTLGIITVAILHLVLKRKL